MYCKYCGKGISRTSKFCRHCGLALTSSVKGSHHFTTPTISAEDHEVTSFAPAGMGKRFFNYVIDYVVILALLYPFAYAVGFVLAATGVSALAHLDQWDDTLLGYMLFGLLYFSYYVLLELTFGKTIGKLITGTKAVDAHGNNLSFGKAFMRTLVRIVPLDWASFLSGGGWHDRWTGTTVVTDK